MEFGEEIVEQQGALPTVSVTVPTTNIPNSQGKPIQVKSNHLSLPSL
jgi:hypothetical protein